MKPLEGPKDYAPPRVDPLDPPHPFDRIRSSLQIKVYLALIVLVIIATAVIYALRS